MTSTARYRLVHFSPSLVGGSRVAIGALVARDGQPPWTFTKAEHVPGASCLGGIRPLSVLRLVLEELEDSGGIDDLPLVLGPQVTLGDGFAVPSGVTDPNAWVRSFVLPRTPRPEQKSLKARSHNAGVVGIRFFEHHHVRQFVRRKFDPRFISAQRKAIRPVTHYVDGRSELLLMEPIVGTRADVEHDLQLVNGSFLAWDKLLDKHEFTRERTFIAYVFGGEKTTDLARSRLSESGARVVNVESLPQRVEFLADIRRVGVSGNLQDELLQ